MRWEARAVLPLVMRKLDRVGAIDLGDDGIDGLADLIDMPVTVVRDGVTDLLQRKTFVMNGSVLVMPNFMAAQEVAKTDAERSREYRARKHAKLVGNAPDESSPPSTPSVTNVTTARDASQNATPFLADPVPSLATPVRDAPPVVLHSTTEDYGLGEAYADAIQQATGETFGLPDFGERILGKATKAHGPKTSVSDRVAWVRKAVRSFVDDTRDDEFARGGYHPSKFLTWLNGGGMRRAIQVPKVVVEYEPPWANETPATPEEIDAAVGDVLGLGRRRA
jgi:hypothetical protein